MDEPGAGTSSEASEGPCGRSAKWLSIFSIDSRWPLCLLRCWREKNKMAPEEAPSFFLVLSSSSFPCVCVRACEHDDARARFCACVSAAEAKKTQRRRRSSVTELAVSRSYQYIDTRFVLTADGSLLLLFVCCLMTHATFFMNFPGLESAKCEFAKSFVTFLYSQEAYFTIFACVFVRSFFSTHSFLEFLLNLRQKNESPP